MLWLLPICVLAEGIDTEHIYGFMIGSDVGDAGERRPVAFAQAASLVFCGPSIARPTSRTRTGAPLR